MTDARRFGGQVAPRQRGRRTHICCSCDCPIAVYGRCAPCFHVYCLTCAASMSRCLICRAPITKLERIPAEASLFISPLTLQGYRSEADLAKHAQQLDGQLRQLMAASAAGMPVPVVLAPQHAQPGPGWKPPPPPGPPPPGNAGGAGIGRPQQQQQQQQQSGMGRQQQQFRSQPPQQHIWPKQGTGAVMVPR